MSEQPTTGGNSQLSIVINASPDAIYRAFLNPDDLAEWLAPDGMTGVIHSFDAGQGGGYRMSLTYTDTDHELPGKSSESTDTYSATFVELIPSERIVETIQFESEAPEFAGEMTITVNLAPVDGGTEVTMIFENIPPGIRPEDNELGSRMSLRKLAALVEP